MSPQPLVQPLPYKRRKYTFFFLLSVFLLALPFLYLYATGYRFEFGEEASLVSTGGIYVAAERTGAEIFIDGELVRETRTFRTAFYAQSLEPGTHRIHVQKKDHHTWVKELPVYPHLVTEAQAFNLPLVPQVRVIAPQQTATGSALVATTTPFKNASTTNEVVATTSTLVSARFPNTEYRSLLELFATSTEEAEGSNTAASLRERFIGADATSTATSSDNAPTTTKEFRNVKLFERTGDVYARWAGPRESMPYYYCAEEFPRYSTSSPTSTSAQGAAVLTAEEADDGETAEELLHPVQEVAEDVLCEPEIRLDRKWQEVTHFDFFPGSSDHVILALEDGVYVIEIDDRAWQNMQPLFLGEELDVRVLNGAIYVYDGELIFQIILA